MFGWLAYLLKEDGSAES